MKKFYFNRINSVKSGNSGSASASPKARKLRMESLENRHLTVGVLVVAVFFVLSARPINVAYAQAENSSEESVVLFPEVKYGFSKTTLQIHSAIKEKLGKGETIPLRGIGSFPQSEINASVSLPCERTVRLYPREVYYGDTIYIAVCYRNISEDDGKRVIRLNRNEWDDKIRKVSATLRFKNKELKYLFEGDGSRGISRFE